MRGLFIGIAVMALGLVIGGFFLTSASAPKTAAVGPIPDRYVAIGSPKSAAANDDTKAAPRRRPASKTAPVDDLLGALDSGGGSARRLADQRNEGERGDGQRARGEEGRFGRVHGMGKIQTGTATGGDLVVGRGSGGMGMRGAGKGGGGEGFGRINGMNKDRAPAARRRSRRPEPIVLEEIAIEGAETPDTVDVDADATLDDEDMEEEEEVAVKAPPLPKPMAAPAKPAPPPPPAQIAAGFDGKRGKKARLKRAAKKQAIEQKSLLMMLGSADKSGRDANTICDALDGDCDGDLDQQLALPARIDLSALNNVERSQGQLSEQRPEQFLPRMCYFENTYLGGNAAYLEQLQRVRSALGNLGPLKHARLDPQAFDAPTDAGMALSASLSHGGLQQPGRVVLQVGLQGSQRYGWRRPPLDVVLVVDGPARARTAAAAKALLAQLSPRDRLGVIRAGDARPAAPVAGIRATRDALLDLAPAAGAGGPPQLAAAMRQAGRMLTRAAGDAARVPGSQTVIVLTQSHGQASAAPAAKSAAHALQLQGAVVSVIQLGHADSGAWWAVANAGHGNFHRVRDGEVAEAVGAELASLSKVVARLLRVNVRLGPHAEAVRVIGSRVLGQQEVKAVKAREVATDRNLSKTMGVKADRGDDDDGVQTVIPYFYGDDSHVILIELWVDPAKARPATAVAEISLKYKDMVNLDNATARTAVYLGRRPEPDTPAQQIVQRNLAGFAFAAALSEAADHADRADWASARQALRNHAATPRDRAVMHAFEPLFGQRAPADLARALRLASRQRKGATAMEVVR